MCLALVAGAPWWSDLRAVREARGRRCMLTHIIHVDCVLCIAYPGVCYCVRAEVHVEHIMLTVFVYSVPRCVLLC